LDPCHAAKEELMEEKLNGKDEVPVLGRQKEVLVLHLAYLLIHDLHLCPFLFLVLYLDWS